MYSNRIKNVFRVICRDKRFRLGPTLKLKKVNCRNYFEKL